ncbi:MAG: DUF642 domain-containing protein [Planctomycetia bacterium]|nr:DUF642 domain-containing protein [Planctomycetia bacterium]
MNQKKFSAKNIGIAVLLAAFGVSSASAQTVNLVQNGSFEQYTGSMQNHGYLYKDGTEYATLPGWTYTPNGTTTNYGYGIGQTSGEFVKNCGPIDGTYALFMQRPGTMTQTVTGLTPGEYYTYSFSYDARNASDKKAGVQAWLDDYRLLSHTCNSQNPFHTYDVIFQATSDTATISFKNTYDQAKDSSLLVDAVSMTLAQDNPWRQSDWAADADLGISSDKTYTHTLNFGQTAESKTVLNVPFKAITDNNYSDGNVTIKNNSRYGNDNDLVNLYGTENPGSQTLAKSFLYSFSSIQLDGLVPGVEYTTTLYLAAFDKNLNARRTGYVGANDGTLFAVEENFYHAENGDRSGGLVKWTGRAAEDGTLTFSFAHSSETLHIYGLTNEVTQGQTPETSGTNLLLATNFGGPNGNSYEGMKVIDTVADVVNFISPAGSEKWQLRENESSATVYSFVENGALHTGANSVNMMEIDSSLLAGKWIDISADLKINTLRGNEKPNARGIGIGFMDESKKTLQGEAGIGFSGLVLNPAGDLMFYENANGSAIGDAKISESIKYLSEDGSAFDANEWYELGMTLAFSEDGETATLVGVGLEGSVADYSTLLGATFKTTDLFAVLSSSAASWNYYGFVDNVRVSEYVPEPSTWALLVLGSSSLLLLRRKGRKQTA